MASTSHHTVPHDIAEESEDGECENGISITTAAAEGIEEPKESKDRTVIVLLVHNTWMCCPGLLEKFGLKLGSNSFQPWVHSSRWLGQD
jgi:hypothetical protein